jgi:hypothetical protein
MSEELPQDTAEIAGLKDKSEPAHPGWLPFAIDFGPLLIFFLTYQLRKSRRCCGFRPCW